MGQEGNEMKTTQARSHDDKKELTHAVLPNEIVAKHILGFALDRKEMLHLMTDAPDLCQHFALEKYYCTIHGGILESQETARSFHETDQRVEVEQPTNNTTEHHAAPKMADGGRGDPKAHKHSKLAIECLDCVHEEFEWGRCPHCDDFCPWEDLNTCEKCEYSCCGKHHLLDHIEMYACEICMESCCYAGGCNKIAFCETCSCHVCDDCMDVKSCNVCDASLGCTDCFHEYAEAFQCDTCDQAYCMNCIDYYNCGDCSSCTCFKCTSDALPTCEECGHKACDQCTMFQCSECETTTCMMRGCTKAYACTACKKEICSDCQDVFPICCCQDKGKFIMKRAAAVARRM